MKNGASPRRGVGNGQRGQSVTVFITATQAMSRSGIRCAQPKREPVCVVGGIQHDAFCLPEAPVLALQSVHGHPGR
jgi:hypothetical protein